MIFIFKFKQRREPDIFLTGTPPSRGCSRIHSEETPPRPSLSVSRISFSLFGNKLPIDTLITLILLAAASPASSCHAQTLNSLRFAQRARLVENQPKINVTKSEEKARDRRASGIFSGISAFDLKKDISRLASMLRSAQTVSPLNNPLSDHCTVDYSLSNQSHTN